MERYADATRMRGNRTEIWWLASTLAAFGLNVSAADIPQKQISNGVVTALVYLPDLERGYYRGVRFDWSGVVASLTYKGHEFFGQWFAKYDPLLNDAIMGPVEEFRGEQDGGLGFAEAKPKGLFIKIGVGVLRKPDDEPYNFARTYRLVNPGKRTVRAESDHIDFVHDLNDGEGYSYQYSKTLRLPRGKSQLVIEHALKNVGKRTIDTDVYNHDFYMLDHQPTGPDVHVRLAFPPQPKDELKPPAMIAGNEVRYEREIIEGASAFGGLTGFSKAVKDNDIRVENVKSGIGVRETADRPLTKLYFWSTRTTVCPEAYIHVHVEPGKVFKWRIIYEFYELNQFAGTKAKATGEGV